MINFFTFAFIALLSMVSLGAEEKPATQQEAIEHIVYEQLPDLLQRGYVFVDLGLSRQDLSALDALQVEDMPEYNRFGNLSLLKEEVTSYLKQMGNADPLLIAQVTQIIEKIVSLVITASGKETAWVCLRASTPHNEFDIPRWHMDGPYYSPRFMPQFKFATALKGNGTLFYPLTAEMRVLYHDTVLKLVASNKDPLVLLRAETRLALSQILDPAQIESAAVGRGAFFVVAHDAVAALHSEPKMDTPRLFMSILPGNERELKELYDDWHKEY